MSSSGPIGGGGSSIYNVPNNNVPVSETGAAAQGDVPVNETPRPAGDGVGFTGGGDTRNVGQNVGGPVVQEQGSGAGFPSLASTDFGDQAALIAQAFKEKATDAARKMEQLGNQKALALQTLATYQKLRSDAAAKLEKLPTGDKASDQDKADAAELNKVISGLDGRINETKSKIGELDKDIDKLGKEVDQARAEMDRKLDSLKQQSERQTKAKEEAKEKSVGAPGPQQKSAAQQALEVLLSTVPIFDQVKRSQQTAQAKGLESSALSAGMKGGA